MGPRRVSLRPQPPSLAQRALVVAIVVFSVGSLVCLHGITGADWSLNAPSAFSSHLRSDAEASPALDHVIAKQQAEPAEQARRAFLKQRASVLSADQSQVVEMAKHAWNAYRAHGNWSDLLDVTNQTGTSLYEHDMAFTAVDALDTLLVMGLHDEFDDASAWIKKNLRERMFVPGVVGFVESSTRSLAGLLAAYHLSGDEHLLQIAAELGESLKGGVTCGIFVPCQTLDLQWGVGRGNPSLAEASSFLLEFRFLAQLSSVSGLNELVDNFNALSGELMRDVYKNGLVPVAMNWDTLQGFASNVSFGALGDTYYEYLLKQWLQTGKNNDALKQSYLIAIDGLREKMIDYTSPSNLTFIGLLATNGTLERRMDHASCFMPGLLALGAHHGLPADHLELAEELMETCVQMYLRSNSTLAAEVTHFSEPSLAATVTDEFMVFAADDYNQLGPETVESLMVLHRVTKDSKYRDYGRQIMEAIENHAKVSSGGYRSTRHVFSDVSGPYGHTMESSLLSETLKYLFLLFSDDDVLSIDDFVFNTHAHAFPMLAATT